MREQSNRLLRHQLVPVRNKSAIASTLDSDGKLDGLLFTPKMARYCGYTFRVYRRAGKTCVEGHGLRRLKSVVLLEGHDATAHSMMIANGTVFTSGKKHGLNP